MNKKINWSKIKPVRYLNMNNVVFSKASVIKVVLVKLW